MEAELMGLAVDTYKLTLMISLPMLMAGLIIGLVVSIFQATTQINEMTLTFVPKILGVVAVLILTMPWMLNIVMDFTVEILEKIPEFPF